MKDHETTKEPRGRAPLDRRVRPVAELLAQVEPTDGPTWKEVFDYIDLNHYALFPEYWTKFLRSIQKHGIKTPIRLERRKGFRVMERQVVANGHHRMWAAVKLGLTEVPVVEV
jgi:hypothetical protein